MTTTTVSTKTYLVFLALFSLPALMYTLATFFHTLYPLSSMTMAILVAIFFASIEYAIKIPVIMYAYDHGISRITIQVVWIIMTLLGAWGLSYLH
jgi:hypothetical protein